MNSLTPAQKITARLQAHNEGAAHRDIIAAHKAQVEAARAAGPTKQSQKQENWVEAIFTQLKSLTDKVTFEPTSFYEHEITIEDGRAYGGYGWRPASIKMPYAVPFHFDEIYESISSWRRRPSGKHSLKIGHYGDTKQFRELKDGGWKYKEIAVEIFERMQRAEAAAKLEAARRNNQSAVEKVLAGLDEKHSPYSGVSVHSSSNSDRPVTVKIDTGGKMMTVEAAIELMNVLKKFNIG